MPSRTSPVPVSEGSAESTALDAGDFRVTRASFPNNAFIAPHVHDRTCVAFMRRGSFDVRFPGKRRVDCTPGTLLVEPVGDTHCNCVGCAGAEVVVIQPDAGAVERSRTLRRFLTGIREVRAPGLAAIAARIDAELVRPDDLTPLVIEALAVELLATAARFGRPPKRKRVSPAWLARAEELLREGFRRGVSLSRLAGECAVSASYLARTFRRHHRCSVGEYQRRLRIDWVADRIRATDDSIATIAAEAGFADQSHLTRWFRSAHGIAPAEWRRRVRS